MNSWTAGARLDSKDSCSWVLSASMVHWPLRGAGALGTGHGSRLHALVVYLVNEVNEELQLGMDWV